MEHARKLFAAEQRVDNQFESEKRERERKMNRENGSTVTSFNDDGVVRNTLGGNMAAGRNQYPGTRLASNTEIGRQSGVADLSLRQGQGRQEFGRQNEFAASNQYQQSNAGGASDKLVRALWFIALLSIGLNMYLALLARSFYSRYNELADELRETFTATV